MLFCLAWVYPKISSTQHISCMFHLTTARVKATCSFLLILKVSLWENEIHISYCGFGVLWLLSKKVLDSRKDNKMAAHHNTFAGACLVQKTGSKLWNYVLTGARILHKLRFTLVRAIVNKQIFFNLVRIA